MQEIILNKFENKPLFWSKNLQKYIFYKKNNTKFILNHIKNRPWSPLQFDIQLIPQNVRLARFI